MTVGVGGDLNKKLSNSSTSSGSEVGTLSKVLTLVLRNSLSMLKLLRKEGKTYLLVRHGVYGIPAQWRATEFFFSKSILLMRGQEKMMVNVFRCVRHQIMGDKVNHSRSQQTRARHLDLGQGIVSCS